METVHLEHIKMKKEKQVEGKTSCKDCPAGQFQNEEGKTSCKNCVKGSTSSAKSSFCTACTNGKTTSEAGKSTCDANCSNSANAGSWKTPTWNYDNSISDLCKINSCISGYSLSSNKCVDSEKPTCTLKATTNGVEFATKTDNVGVTAYGMNKTGTANYNSTTKLDLSAGTFYGYVKDAAGNTNKCSISIEATKATKWTKKSKTCYSGTAASGTYRDDKYFSGPTAESRCQGSCSSVCYCSDGTIQSCGCPVSVECTTGTCSKTGCTCSTTYYFGSETTDNNQTSCTDNSISCNSGNVGKTNVTCTASAYGCKSSGYTKINDSWCYK